MAHRGRHSADKKETRQGGLDLVLVPAGQGRIDNGGRPTGTEGTADGAGGKAGHVGPTPVHTTGAHRNEEPVPPIADEQQT